MKSFNNEESEKLDEEIITALGTLLESQKTVQENIEKKEFFLKERKMIYKLFIRVNEERRVCFI